MALLYLITTQDIAPERMVTLWAAIFPSILMLILKSNFPFPSNPFYYTLWLKNKNISLFCDKYFFYFLRSPQRWKLLICPCFIQFPRLMVFFVPCYIQRIPYLSSQLKFHTLKLMHFSILFYQDSLLTSWFISFVL